MLEAVNLSKRYNDQTAPDSLNLVVEPGEVFCLLGANGAGKTTTINLFLNFIDPSSGKALIKDLDVTAAPLETKRYLAYIPEQVMLYKNLSGLENLEYFSALAGKDVYTKEELFRFIDEVGLTRDAAQKRVATYSKGMRQKVGIKHLHLHQTRHTYARLVAESTGSIIETQDALGHKSAATTRVYAQRINVKRDKHSEATARMLDSGEE